MSLPLNFIVEQQISNIPSVFDVSGTMGFSHELSAAPAIPGGVLPVDRLVQVNQPVHIHIQWKVSGWLTTLFSTADTWRIQVYMEQFGALDFELPEINSVKNVPHQPVDPFSYFEVLTIPANAMKPGIYNMVVSLRLYDQFNNPRPFAAFAELGNIEFYKPL